MFFAYLCIQLSLTGHMYGVRSHMRFFYGRCSFSVFWPMKQYCVEKTMCKYAPTTCNKDDRTPLVNIKKKNTFNAFVVFIAILLLF